jgi:glutamate carboxypeptidase
MQERALLEDSFAARMPEALDMLRRMVGINSYTGNPDGVNRLGRFTAESFVPLGFSSEFVPSTNPDWGSHLFLNRPGGAAQSIAMVSHLDTVFPPEEEIRNNFHWNQEGSRIYGPGTHDIKGGTVMMWLVLATLKDHFPEVFEKTAWHLFLNSSEETLSKDFGEHCSERMDRNTLAALVFEAEGRLGSQPLLVTSRKGRATWRITATGRGAHAGGKHRHGANAAVQLAHTIQKVANLTDLRRDLTFNVGTISGGGAFNRVPHEAFAEGEFRAFSPEVYSDAMNQLMALAGEGEVRSVADRFPCRLEVTILDESRPWPRNPGSDRLFEIWRNAGERIGMEVGVEERGGLSDGNLLWDLAPTIDGLGPWGDNDHCSERSADGTKEPEYVDLDSFVPKALLNVLAIVDLAQSGN